MVTAKNPLARVLAKVTVTPFNCWDYNGYRTRDGYGRAMWSRRLWLTHRMVYTLMIGPIPDGLVMDHLCKNTSCCNPEHLEVVTRSENTRRGTSWHGFAARQSAKTHCPKGHEYTAENIYRQRGKNGRSCKQCRRDVARRWASEHRAQLAARDRERYARKAAA